MKQMHLKAANPKLTECRIQDKIGWKQMLNSNFIFLSPSTSFPAYLIKVPFPQTSVMKEKSIFRATSWKV